MTYAQDVITILIASPHRMFREALRTLLDCEFDFSVIGEASSGSETIERTRALQPHVLLLDAAIQDLSVLDVLRSLAKDAVRARPLLLLDGAGQQVVEALKLGAYGVVAKRTSPQLLNKGIRVVAAGQYWVGHDGISDLIRSLRTAPESEAEHAHVDDVHLTDRQVDIVTCIVDGYTNKEIAERFAISEQTVKHHLTAIFEKLGVGNRVELALYAVHRQLTPQL
jgi:DNA-binding NarL/FixJ family response regulator